jgi:hypothetical protein
MDFCGIFRVSGVDATSRDFRVGGDCEAGEFEVLAGLRAEEIPGVGRLSGWLGLERENGNDDRCLGIDRAQRKRFLKNTHDLAGDLLGVKTRALQPPTIH